MKKILIAVSLACIAIGIQLLLIPVVAIDSYQLFLGAVAVSSIHGGSIGGLLTLAICGLGKLYFFMPADILAMDSALALRTVLFLALAIVICWIGGRFHASEQGLAAVLSSIADAVIAIDEKGRIKFMNPAAEALSGWTQKAAVKHNCSEVIHFRDIASGATIPAHGVSDALDGNTVLDSRAGCAIPVDASISVMPRSAAGSGRVIVLRDITERRRAEQERERLLSEIQSATAKVRVLRGMLPICAGCKQIRDERGHWYAVETYVEAHTEAEFSHSLCPECMKYYCPGLRAEVKAGGTPESHRSSAAERMLRNRIEEEKE